MQKTAFIFDVDGVLLDPLEKRITVPDLMPALAAALKRGAIIALNTGRSLDTLDEKVLPFLNQAIADEQITDPRIFVAAEKGAVWSIRSPSGDFARFRNEEVSVPAELQTEVQALVRTQFASTMFFDETKTAMISVEMRDHADHEKFREEQHVLNEAFRDMLSKRNLTSRFRIDPTIIATDIESIELGKHEGIRRLLSWLESQKIPCEKFFAFGDSTSDLPMAEELKRREKNFEFVFVGDDRLLDGKSLEFPVRRVGGLCQGTLRALRELSADSSSPQE